MLSVHDAEGRFLYVTGALEALSGHAADDVLAETPCDLDLVHANDLDDVVAVQARALGTREQWRIQYRLRRTDDAYVWVESAGVVVSVNEGTWFVALTREATHMESLLQGIAFERRLHQQLDELVARQQRFLTTVSHSARTPLTAISGMLELLRSHGDQLDDERRGQLLERLQANSSRLTELLDEVTDADRLAREDVVLQRRVVRVRDVAQAVVDELTGAGGHVTNEIDADLLAVADEDRLRRLLTILVGNALHHGGIGTTVALHGTPTDTNGIELVVADDGPGIAPEDRDAVFEPFSHGTSDQPDPGAGLGLYVVAELVALHRGRIWIDDNPGGGARFHVRLPPGRPDRDERPEPDDDDASGPMLRPDGQVVIEQVLATLRRRVGLDLVYLSILDDEFQHIVAAAGTTVAGVETGRRVPLADTFCVRMLTGELEHVVGNTRGHAVVGDMPATEDGLACYVGVPVHLPSGKVFGTLCAASAEPHTTLPPSVADEFSTFADVIGDQLANEGFIDETAMDAATRVVNVLTAADGLQVVYQPIVDLRSGRVTSIEALARFTGSDRPVDLWFSDAARSGLLVDLEVRAVELALAGLDLVTHDVHLAVNVSPHTLMTPELAAVLDDAPLERLVLEVTEHAAIDDYEPLLQAIGPLRGAGLRVAVDDMGTGYAGLGHLLQLHPDVLKIDRSLVTNLDEHPPHRATVAGLTRLAEHLDADVVAEGVEGTSTLRAVRELGFTHAQGYLLCRPTAEPDLEAIADAAQSLLQD